MWKLTKKEFVPWESQMRAMKAIVSQSGTRIFLKPGGGKTALTLKAFDALKRAGHVDALLVLAPLRVIATSWPQQLEFWKDFEHLTYTTIHGGEDARRYAMSLKRDVYLMNVEGLIGKEWKLDKLGNPNQLALKWLKGKRVMLVVDESTKFKNPASSRSKTLKKYLPHFDRAVILTGTPRPGKLEDLFFQCYITDQGADLGKYVTHFRRLYMMPHHSGYGWTEQVGAAARVAEKIAPTTVQFDTKQAVPSRTNYIWLPMPPGVEAQYKELAREFMTEIENETVMAVNSGVLFGKLRQFAQGAIFSANDRGWSEVHQLKLDALETLLEELNGDPLFCLYAYRHDIDRINERLKREVPLVGGGVSIGAGRAACMAFAAGAEPLMLGHPQSVAHGIDGLQNNCANVCWFGNDPSWENTYQANLRIVRPGSSAEEVIIHHIMLDCGIERAVLSKVLNKEMGESAFLSEIKKQLAKEV